MLKLLLIISVLWITACATPTPYQSGSDDHVGYRELKLQDSRYRVAFKGNSVTARETVEVCRRGFPYYAMGWGSTVTESNSYEAIAYITMKKGKVPEDNSSAYDAREVQKNLEEMIKRPKPKD